MSHRIKNVLNRLSAVGDERNGREEEKRVSSPSPPPFLDLLYNSASWGGVSLYRPWLALHQHLAHIGPSLMQGGSTSGARSCFCLSCFSGSR
jgi:hypothetical protein